MTGDHVVRPLSSDVAGHRHGWPIRHPQAETGIPSRRRACLGCAWSRRPEGLLSIRGTIPCEIDSMLWSDVSGLPDRVFLSGIGIRIVRGGSPLPGRECGRGIGTVDRVLGGLGGYPVGGQYASFRGVAAGVIGDWTPMQTPNNPLCPADVMWSRVVRISRRSLSVR
jgi:hypothetical protein